MLLLVLVVVISDGGVGVDGGDSSICGVGVACVGCVSGDKRSGCVCGDSSSGGVGVARDGGDAGDGGDSGGDGGVSLPTNDKVRLCKSYINTFLDWDFIESRVY